MVEIKTTFKKPISGNMIRSEPKGHRMTNFPSDTKINVFNFTDLHSKAVALIQESI